MFSVDTETTIGQVNVQTTNNKGFKPRILGSKNNGTTN